MQFNMIFDNLEVVSKVQELLRLDDKEIKFQSILEDDNNEYIISVDIDNLHDTLIIRNLLKCLDDIAESDSEEVFNYLIEKTKLKGNPFHDRLGHFTGKAGLKGGGSRSLGGKAKQQVTGVKGKFVQYGKTYKTGWGDKNPCGRDARYSKVSKGEDVRCSQGESHKQVLKKLGKAIKKKKAKKKVKSSGKGSKSEKKISKSRKSSKRSGGGGGGGGTFSQAAKMMGLEK